MHSAIDQTLIDRKTIAARVQALAGQIVADLRREHAPDQPLELTLVPVLTGSFIFVADLIRHLPLPMQIHLMSVSSYPGTATTSRGPRLQPALTELPESLDDRHVLVVDDILDSGKTLQLVRQTLLAHEPASLRTCVLLRKERPQAMQTPVDYVAFDIPDLFVVGYGLDYDDYYRNLPDIVTLK